MLSILLWLTIVINEVVPAPSSGPEYVELYNASNTIVDVSGWRIDDDTPGGTVTTIAAGTTIAPQQLVVIALNSAILNNTGDAVVLLDAVGNQIDRIDFGAMKSGESMARIPDGSTTIVKTSTSIGQFNLPATPTSTMTTTPTSSATMSITPAQIPATDTPQMTTTQTIQSSNSPLPPSITPSTTFTTHTPQSTVTASATPPATPTLSLTASVSVTISPTASLPISVTVIREHTGSVTKTPSYTKTASVTRTPSISKTPSQTKTPSLTLTPSDTRTPSLSKTPSDTRTSSPTKTPSDTRTPSLTKTLILPKTTRTARTTGPGSAITAPANDVTLTLALDAHRRPLVVICVPAPATLAGWYLNTMTPFAPSTPRCTQIRVDATATQIDLYNPHHLHMASLAVAEAWCALDISACLPSPTPSTAATPVIALWPTSDSRVTASVHATTAATTKAVTVEIPPAPMPAPWPWGGIGGGFAIGIGVWVQRRVAQSHARVLYCAPGDDAESSINGVSSESGSV